MLKVLLKAGADPDFVDNEGQTPLFYAVKGGKVDIVNELIATGGVDLSREDIKGQSLVALALKHKRQQIADTLVNAGSP